eukprot:678155-Pelagomonas_calceolata.AAC.4
MGVSDREKEGFVPLHIRQGLLNKHFSSRRVAHSLLRLSWRSSARLLQAFKKHAHLGLISLPGISMNWNKWCLWRDPLFPNPLVETLLLNPLVQHGEKIQISMAAELQGKQWGSKRKTCDHAELGIIPTNL